MCPGKPGGQVQLPPRVGLLSEKSQRLCGSYDFGEWFPSSQLEMAQWS